MTSPRLKVKLARFRSPAVAVVAGCACAVAKTFTQNARDFGCASRVTLMRKAIRDGDAALVEHMVFVPRRSGMRDGELSSPTALVDQVAVAVSWESSTVLRGLVKNLVIAGVGTGLVGPSFVAVSLLLSALRAGSNCLPPGSPSLPEVVSFVCGASARKE